MKKIWVLTLTILLASATFSACNLNLGENTSARSDSEKRDEEKTEKVEKKEKKNKDKAEKTVAQNDEDLIAEDKTSAPDPKSNALSGSERPAGESKAISNALGTKNQVASNDDWLYVYDSRRGYGFYVPNGTTGDRGKVKNVDTFAGFTPNNIGIYVFAWQDRQATRETLLKNAKNILEGMGETVKTGEIVGASDNFAVVEATSVDKQGVKSKMKVLVGTDVTDNYVMIVGCDEKDYNAKKATIEQIWGSFEMWSGGRR
ncbi:MAG: hypothetical protein ACR2MG_15195 [Pyrinomonadaceae bacterium]